MTRTKTAGLGRPSVKDYPKELMLGKPAEKYVQVQVAAERCGVTRGRIYQLITEKRMRAKKLRPADHEGLLLYVREADVMAYRSYQEERQKLLQAAGL